MDEKKYCIYELVNKINGKKYIGQTCQKPNYRWGHGNGYKNNEHLTSSIELYGWENFEHNILYENLSAEEADEIEIKLIAKYDLQNREKGYNIDGGGTRANRIISEETKLKQSISAQNRPIVTEETKQKLSDIGKGLKRTEETKQKLSNSSLQREEEKRKLGIKKERPVKCINTQQIFKSCREAADWCGLVGTSGIASVCRNGKQKTAGVHPETKEKLKWEYVV